MPSLNSQGHVIALGLLLGQSSSLATVHPAPVSSVSRTCWGQSLPPCPPSTLLLSVLCPGHAGARACLPAQGLSLLLACLAQPQGCTVLGLRQDSLGHLGTVSLTNGLPQLGGSCEPCTGKKKETVCKNLPSMFGLSFPRLPVLPGSGGCILQLPRGTTGGPGTGAQLRHSHCSAGRVLLPMPRPHGMGALRQLSPSPAQLWD